MKKLVRKFREKLKEEGRTLRWFHQSNFRTMSYMSFIQQVNGYYTISDTVLDAIKNYLAEE